MMGKTSRQSARLQTGGNYPFHLPGINPSMALCLFAAAIIQTSAIKMEVIYSEVANLTYQLDTVAGLNRATDPRDFQALWKRDFLKSPEDQVFLDRWTAIRRRYEVSVNMPSLFMPLTPRRSSISISDRIRSAGLEAKSFEDYEADLNLLVLPTEVHEFTDVLKHFQPTFRRWWTAEAAEKGKTFATGMQARLQEPQIVQSVERFRKFYGSQLPDGYRAPFSLIYRPMLVVTSTSGEQLDRTSVVEFLPTEKPEQRLEVVLHEFCHFLYGTRSPESDQKLQNAFVTSKDPLARPSYNLLNEGLASAMGNGVIGRMFRGPEAWKQYLAAPRSFYNNLNIDRAGKRLYRLLEANPDTRLDSPTFVGSYISALKEVFGEELSSPVLFLNESFIYVNATLGEGFAGKIMRTLRVSSGWTRTDSKLEAGSLNGYTSQPNSSALFVMPADALPQLLNQGIITTTELSAIQKAAKGGKGALFAKSRGVMANVYVLTANDEAEAGRRLEQLAAAKKGFTGVAAF